MPFARASFFALACGLVACSSTSNGAPATDAGYDAGYDSAPPPYVPIGNVDDSGPGTTHFDAGSTSQTCLDLEAKVNQAASAASVCNPSATSQCTATTPGICCPITVSFGVDPSLTDDVQADVAAFHNAGCSIDCTKFPCEPTPSKKCVGSGLKGTCQ